MRAKSKAFEVRKHLIKYADGKTYVAWRVTGWFADERVRKQFATEAEARGEKLRLEVNAANTAVRILPTRLDPDQLADAEAAMRRLEVDAATRGTAIVTMGEAVDWFLRHYRPVGIDSTPGQGARFWFELPAAS